jgi:hypothetical protein
MNDNSTIEPEIEVPAVDVVHRYFEVAAQANTERYLALFASDATAEDDGHTYHGVEQIREWRIEVVPVSYDVRDIRRIGPDLRAVVEISGNFPGSPVTLRFLFQISAEGLITRLIIGS